MKVYTKTGDKGQTSLIGGKKVSKADLRIEAYGTVDELNSFIGLLRDQEVNQTSERQSLLQDIQDNLFVIGSILATVPGYTKFKLPEITEANVDQLEEAIDEMTEQLPELKHFILPGGNASVSVAHICRTVTRRAERSIIRLDDDKTVSPVIVKYVNRLSDYFFVLGRKMGKELNADEINWIPKS
ncbi:MAG: cob(I)yrinic acid a,c-diamide adenosyltransferase [Cyclobacteriaceae bacterium]